MCSNGQGWLVMETYFPFMNAMLFTITYAFPTDSQLLAVVCQIMTNFVQCVIIFFAEIFSLCLTCALTLTIRDFVTEGFKSRAGCSIAHAPLKKCVFFLLLQGAISPLDYLHICTRGDGLQVLYMQVHSWAPHTSVYTNQNNPLIACVKACLLWTIYTDHLDPPLACNTSHVTLHATLAIRRAVGFF